MEQLPLICDRVNFRLPLWLGERAVPIFGQFSHVLDVEFAL